MFCKIEVIVTHVLREAQMFYKILEIQIDKQTGIYMAY